MIPRRTFLRSLLVAPAIIRTPGLLMPVKPLAEVTSYLVTGIDIGAVTGDFSGLSYYQLTDIAKSLYPGVPLDEMSFRAVANYMDELVL